MWLDMCLFSFTKIYCQHCYSYCHERPGWRKAAEMKVKEQEAREREMERIMKHNQEVQENSRMRFEAHMYSWNWEIWLKQQAKLRKKEQVRKLIESWERSEKEAAKKREREEKEWKEKLVREASRATALEEEAELKERKRKGKGPCSTQYTLV